LKLFQEWEEGGIKEKVGRGEFNMMYLMYHKNFYKCHNVPPPSTRKNKRNTLNGKKYFKSFQKKLKERQK
jgi:hypothetical protein